MADTLGNTITQHYNTLTTDSPDYSILSGNEWVASDRINVETNQNFSSWGDFFGPHLYNGDFFTTPASN